MNRPDYFHSSQYGGCEVESFSEIHSQQELEKILNQRNQTELMEDKENSVNDLRMIYYCFGTISSGSFQPKGIDKIVLNGENLEVYLTKEDFNPNDMKYQEQVVSNPWMIFSIPKNLQYKNIVIK